MPVVGTHVSGGRRSLVRDEADEEEASAVETSSGCWWVRKANVRRIRKQAEAMSEEAVMMVAVMR